MLKKRWRWAASRHNKDPLNMGGPYVNLLYLTTLLENKLAGTCAELTRNIVSEAHSPTEDRNRS